jgi:hypothetical protein
MRVKVTQENQEEMVGKKGRFTTRHEQRKASDVECLVEWRSGGEEEKRLAPPFEV